MGFRATSMSEGGASWVRGCLVTHESVEDTRTMKDAVFATLVLVAVAAWLSAVLHGFASLAHLSGKNSFGQMLFHGIRWFDPENFTERGQVLQRRFVRSFIAFFVVVVLLALAGVLLQGR